MIGILARVYILLHRFFYTVFTILVKNIYRNSNGFIPKDEAFAMLKDAGYEFIEFECASDFLNEESMDLSIIVPVYNGECYLRKCLDSIMSQRTSYSYEVICINDGSKDDSLAILEQYRQKYDNITVYSKENAVISGARNKCIEL
ncbi:MAG: glycosyltransferase, partial [Prevotellaceae bacterium]|nr:glycosyltransferase [Prevotellaceae bacterium]